MVRPRPLSYQSTLKLIKEVKKHSCIWDREHEHYNDRYNVGLAWKTIALRLNLSEETAKLKWKSLRDCFNRKIKKNPMHRQNYTGTWEYFNAMTFTLKHERVESIAEIEEEYLEIHDEENTIDLELQDGKPNEYYDLLFLESLVPYFKQLEPRRKIAMRREIQNILEKEIASQRDKDKDLVYVDALECSD